MAENSRLRFRLALVLLLPIFMRTTTLYKCSMVIINTLAITSAAVYFRRKTFDFEFAKRIAIAGEVLLLANYGADRAVLGPWTRLCMVYLFSWDALWHLLPDVATGHKAFVALARYGFINTMNTQLWVEIQGPALLYAFADPLLCLSVAIVRGFHGAKKVTMRHETQKANGVRISAAEEKTPAFGSDHGIDVKSTPSVELDSSITRTAGKVVDTGKNKPRVSTGEKEKCWEEVIIGGTAVELGGMPLPVVQSRPSTQKRGYVLFS